MSPRINIGIVYGLNGRPTGEVFLSIDDEAPIAILSPVEALEAAEGLAAVAFIVQENRAPTTKPTN